MSFSFDTASAAALPPSDDTQDGTQDGAVKAAAFKLPKGHSVVGPAEEAPAAAAPALPAGHSVVGPTDPKVTAAPVGYGEDIGRSAGAGLTEGSAGVASSGLKGVGWLESKFDPYLEKAIAPIGRAAGFNPQPVAQPGAQASKWGSDVEAATEAATAGTPFDPTYQSQTTPGRYTRSVAQNLPLVVATGPMSPEAIAARVATQAVAPGVGSQALGDVGKATGSPTLEAGGRVVGALGGGAAAGALKEGAGALGTLLHPPVSPEVMEQTAQLGMKPLPRFAATDSPLAAPAVTALSKPPIINLPLRSAAKGASADLEAAAGRLGTQAGATSPITAGQDIEQGFRADQAAMSTAAETKYNAVKDAVPPAANVDSATGALDNTQQAAVDIANRRAAAGGAPGPAITAVTKPLQMNATGGMTYDGMRDLRTSLRQAGEAPGLTPGEAAEYGKLEGAVTADLKTHLNTLDPSGTAASKMAEADTTYANDIARQKAVNKKLGIDANAPRDQFIDKIEGMASSAKPDVETLNQIKSTLPPKVMEQAGASIAQKWWSDPQTGQFNPTQFFQKYSSLTDAGKDALFGPKGSSGFRSSYDSLAALSQRAPILQAAGPAATTGGKVTIGGLGIGEAAAAWFHPIATALGAGAGTSMTYLMSRPATASSLARLARAQQGYQVAQKMNQGVAAATRILANEANNFANTANDAGANIDPNDFRTKLMGQ